MFPVSTGALCVLEAMALQCERILSRLDEEIGISNNVSDFEGPCASENVALRH